MISPSFLFVNLKFGVRGRLVVCNATGRGPGDPALATGSLSVSVLSPASPEQVALGLQLRTGKLSAFPELHHQGGGGEVPLMSARLVVWNVPEKRSFLTCTPAANLPRCPSASRDSSHLGSLLKCRLWVRGSGWGVHVADKAVR